MTNKPEQRMTSWVTFEAHIYVQESYVFILNFLLGVLFNELILLKNDFLATSLQVNIFFSFLNAFVSKSFFHPIHKP